MRKISFVNYIILLICLVSIVSAIGCSQCNVAETRDNLSKCYEAYYNYLSTSVSWETNTWYYSFLYLDDDEYPEMVYGHDLCHGSGAHILIYDEASGTANEYEFGAYGQINYIERSGIIGIKDYHMDYYTEYYAKVADGSIDLDYMHVISEVTDYEEDPFSIYHSESCEFYKGGQPITCEKFLSEPYIFHNSEEWKYWYPDENAENTYCLNITVLEYLRIGENPIRSKYAD